MHIGLKFKFLFFYCQRCEKKNPIKISVSTRAQPPELTSQMLLSKSFLLRLYVPVNIFFSHVGTEPTLPGFNQLERS